MVGSIGSGPFVFAIELRLICFSLMLSCKKEGTIKTKKSYSKLGDNAQNEFIILGDLSEFQKLCSLRV